MNIIYEIDKNNLRLISFNPYEVYQLDELKFYIPKNNKITPFLLIQDSKKNKDIIKLSLVGKESNYNIYSASTLNSISVKEGKLEIMIFIVKDSSFLHSNLTSLSLKFDNYKIGNQLTLIEGLSRHLISTYQKIEQLTQMNIEIYQNIEEVQNNDNI